jgi:hypothetical protein
MSRSIRRPFCTHGQKNSKSKQFWKREASRMVRNSEDIPNGRAYRKFFDRWNIDDYRWYQSPRDIEKHWPEWWKLLRK